MRPTTQDQIETKQSYGLKGGGGSGRSLHAVVVCSRGRGIDCLPQGQNGLPPAFIAWSHVPLGSHGAECGSGTSFRVFVQAGVSAPVTTTLTHTYTVRLLDTYKNRTLCIKAIGAGISGNLTLYSKYRVRQLDPLPGNLEPDSETTQHVGTTTTTNNAKVKASIATETFISDQDYGDYFKRLDGYPSRFDSQWRGPYSWPGEKSGRATEGDGIPFNPVYFPVDWSSPQMMLARGTPRGNASTKCTKENLENKTVRVRGVCSLKIELELLVPAASNQPIGIWAQDLCYNGWDDIGGTENTTTVIEVIGENSAGTAVKRTIGRNRLEGRGSPHNPTGTGRDDCFEDIVDYNSQLRDNPGGPWISPGGTASDPKVSDWRISYLGGGINDYFKRSSNEVFGGSSGPWRFAPAAYHLYELFPFNHETLGSIGDNLTLQNIPANDITEDPKTIEYKRYKLRIRFHRTGQPLTDLPWTFSNLFKLSLATNNDISQYSILDRLPGTALEPSLMTLSNSQFYSNNSTRSSNYNNQNDYRWDGSGRVRATERNSNALWTYTTYVGVPCSAVTDADWAQDVEELYREHGIPWGGQHLVDSDGPYILAPIGMFDSDLNAGDYITHKSPYHRLWVYETDGDPKNSSGEYAKQSNDNPADGLIFNGSREQLPKRKCGNNG